MDTLLNVLICGVIPLLAVVIISIVKRMGYSEEKS